MHDSSNRQVCDDDDYDDDDDDDDRDDHHDDDEEEEEEGDEEDEDEYDDNGDGGDEDDNDGDDDAADMHRQRERADADMLVHVVYRVVTDWLLSFSIASLTPFRQGKHSEPRPAATGPVLCTFAGAGCRALPSYRLGFLGCHSGGATNYHQSRLILFQRSSEPHSTVKPLNPQPWLLGL